MYDCDADMVLEFLSYCIESIGNCIYFGNTTTALPEFDPYVHKELVNVWLLNVSAKDKQMLLHIHDVMLASICEYPYSRQLILGNVIGWTTLLLREDYPICNSKT